MSGACQVWCVSVHEGFDIAPEMLQTPLVVALAISPIFLLVNRSLINVSFGKKKIFEVIEHLKLEGRR